MRIRIRDGNLTMTNHRSTLTATSPKSLVPTVGLTAPGTRWPEVTTDVAVGQMRVIEFIANEPGDWTCHCHKSHHTRNAMGHYVLTMIGVDHSGIPEKISKIVPDYMVMGDKGGSMAV